MISEVPRPQTQQERYRKIKLLGQGAMGKVYLVQCLADQQLYVIKRIQTEHLQQKQRQDLEKEAFLLQLLNHQNIIKFKEIYTTKKHKLCIVMEYADGGDLENKIQEQQGKHFEQKQILTWLAQITLGLKYIHERKIVHRDIKGANIFLTKDGVCKIGDFGISKMMNKTMETHKSFVGTPSYLSPEMVEGKSYNTKADIWALGVILYQLCALKLPFEANSLPVLALRIMRGQFSPLPKNIYSKELQQLILNMLKVDSKKRPTALDILKNSLLRPYVPASQIVSQKTIPQKTVKLVNINKQFEKGKQKSPRGQLQKLQSKNAQKEKREALRKQMKEDLNKKRLEARNQGDIKQKIKKPELIVEQPQYTLPKLTVKPWKLNNKLNKSSDLPIQIMLPVKRQPKQTKLQESQNDFTVEIKMSDKTKLKLEEMEMERELEKSRSNNEAYQEQFQEQEEVEEEIEEEDKQNGNQLQDVRNVIQGINLKFGGVQLPDKIVLNQYDDSLDNFQTIVSDKNIKEPSQQDECLKYITSTSSTAQQLRILLEQKLGCSKFVRTYKTLKQYTQNLIKANKQLQFDKQKLRSHLNFLSREQFDSNLYSLYTLLVLENEDIRHNFDNFD